MNAPDGHSGCVCPRKSATLRADAVDISIDDAYLGVRYGLRMRSLSVHLSSSSLIGGASCVHVLLEVCRPRFALEVLCEYGLANLKKFWRA